MTTEGMTPAENARKRVRISIPEVEVVEDPSKKSETAPSQAARLRVEAAVALYPQAIQTIALSASKVYNRQKSKIRSQDATIKRFDDENEIPGSAKLNFQLTAPPAIMEMDEFKTQATLMETAVAAFQKAAKSAIKSVAEIRLEYEKTTATATLLETLQRLCELILLENRHDSKEQPVAKFAWFVAGKLPLQVFKECYCSQDHIRNELKRNIDDDNQEEGNGVLQITSGDNDRFADLTTRVGPILTSIFVDSWNAQIDSYRQAEITRTLAKKAKELLLVKAAENVQMEIDTEPSVSSEKIKELIAAAVKNETKKQQNEISKLRETVKRSKNSNRGAPSSSAAKASASSKKKNGEKQKQEKEKGSRPAQKEKDTGNSRARKEEASPKGRKSILKQPHQKKKSGKANNSRKQK
jgi:hypothetical protein